VIGAEATITRHPGESQSRGKRFWKILFRSC